MLQLFAASGKAHFQFKSIVALEILASAIEGDESRHVDRQALLDIGRFERRAAHGDGAMFRRDGEPDRRQRPQCNRDEYCCRCRRAPRAPAQP
jgi:hypothetical protein